MTRQPRCTGRSPTVTGRRRNRTGDCGRPRSRGSRCFPKTWPAALAQSGSTSRRSSSPRPARCRRSSASTSRSCSATPSGCRAGTTGSTWRSASTAPRCGATPTGGSRRPPACWLLAAGGRLVFLRPSPLFALCVPPEGQASTALLRPQFGLCRLDWGKSTPHWQRISRQPSQDEQAEFIPAVAERASHPRAEGGPRRDRARLWLAELLLTCRQLLDPLPEAARVILIFTTGLRGDRKQILVNPQEVHQRHQRRRQVAKAARNRWLTSVRVDLAVLHGQQPRKIRRPQVTAEQLRAKRRQRRRQMPLLPPLLLRLVDLAVQVQHGELPHRCQRRRPTGR